MGANAVRAVPTSGTAREAIRRDARGAKATPVSRAQRQTATAFNPSNSGLDRNDLPNLENNNGEKQ